MSPKEKRVLVTGAGGFVGTHLCQSLDAQGAQVVGLVRTPKVVKKHFAEQYVIDISDRLRIRQLVNEIRPDLVVHLAADKNRGIDSTGYRAGYEANLIGSLNLIEACQELTTLAGFVFLGSCEEYGRQQAPFDESVRESPVSAYAVTKLAVTQLLQTLARAKRFPAVILRPTIVYGPGQNMDMLLPALIKSLLSGRRFGMSLGAQTRDFLYIDDLVSAIMHALSAPGTRGRVINISSALPIRIDDLAKRTARLIGAKAEGLLDFGARDYRPGEAMDYWASNSLAEKLLDWVPSISLDDGLRQTINYYRTEVSTG